MHPDLFSIGPFTIHAYGLLVAMGFVTGILVTVRLGKNQAFSTQQVMDMAFIMILWAIVGSRLLYILINLPYYTAHPIDILKIWQGGLVFSGGLIAVASAMALYLRRHHISFWAAGDLWAPALAVGQAIGRIGCFMAGCCYGKPTDLPWGVIFTNPQSLAPRNIPLHPTQIYSSLAGFSIFFILLALYGRRKFQGQVFLWYLILHSTARLFVERFRGDGRGLIPGTEMTLTQLVAVGILIAAIVALFALKPEGKRKGASL
jgi:phosphatidylglycerol---prolipoprotein diacylglyceryl transferase